MKLCWVLKRYDFTGGMPSMTANHVVHIKVRKYAIFYWLNVKFYLYHNKNVCQLKKKKNRRKPEQVQNGWAIGRWLTKPFLNFFHSLHAAYNDGKWHWDYCRWSRSYTVDIEWTLLPAQLHLYNIRHRQVCWNNHNTYLSFLRTLEADRGVLTTRNITRGRSYKLSKCFCTYWCD